MNLIYQHIFFKTKWNANKVKATINKREIQKKNYKYKLKKARKKEGKGVKRSYSEIWINGAKIDLRP